MKEAQKKMEYDHYNPEIEEHDMDNKVMELLKQKTPVARPMENPHHVDGVARSEHCTPMSNKVKKEDLEDWKAQILAEMTKKIGGYGRFSNPQDLAMMAIRGVNKSPFAEWIGDQPKPKDFVIPTFKQFDAKLDLVVNRKWL